MLIAGRACLRLPVTAMDFVDLRLTSAQNEAARALVGRFMDVFDGHVRMHQGTSTFLGVDGCLVPLL